MQSTPIADLLSGKHPTESDVFIQGWVRTRRDSKAGMSFVNISDGSCFDPIQVIVDSDVDNYQDTVLHLSTGCAVAIHGRLVASPGKGQQVEIQGRQVELVGGVDDPETYPISPKRHTLEYLREVQHLRPRTNIIGAMARVRHTLAQAIHRFFHEQGFYWISTPLITASDCEGAGELFRVSTLDLVNPPKTAEGDIDFQQDFFGQETFLTVSGQLNVESYCMALSKVYTFGPTFRAENSNTSRHLAEFWMIEPEIAFANLDDNIVLADKLLKYVLTALLDERADDMAFFQQRVDKECITRLEQFIQHDVERMTYTDAVNALQQAKKRFDFPVTWGTDLQSEHERYLVEELVGKPLVVTDYPKDIKGFYMMLNDDDKTVAAMDVLAPGIGEIIGGSQREHRTDVLEQRMRECNMDPHAYQWYLDLRRYGSTPHAGFGLGFERLVCYVTGIANVRDAIPFPRAKGHANL